MMVRLSVLTVLFWGSSHGQRRVQAYHHALSIVWQECVQQKDRKYYEQNVVWQEESGRQNQTKRFKGTSWGVKSWAALLYKHTMEAVMLPVLPQVPPVWEAVPVPPSTLTGWGAEFSPCRSYCPRRPPDLRGPLQPSPLHVSHMSCRNRPWRPLPSCRLCWVSPGLCVLVSSQRLFSLCGLSARGGAGHGWRMCFGASRRRLPAACGCVCCALLFCEHSYILTSGVFTWLHTSLTLQTA